MNYPMRSLHPEVSAICKHADKILWDAFVRSGEGELDTYSEGHLIFPRYRKKDDLRVSEQEARFAFVEALNRGPFWYSVEVPTSKKYSPSGKGSRSASTDLQLQELDNTAVCNIEFKAHGVSTDAADKSSIYKDVEKLLCERVWGIWFHLLDGVDKTTINKFLSVIVEQAGRVRKESNNKIESPGLTLHICVLRYGFSLHKDILLPVNEAELASQLKVNLPVPGKELEQVRELNGWELERKRRQ